MLHMMFPPGFTFRLTLDARPSNSVKGYEYGVDFRRAIFFVNLTLFLFFDAHGYDIDVTNTPATVA